MGVFRALWFTVKVEAAFVAVAAVAWLVLGMVGCNHSVTVADPSQCEAACGSYGVFQYHTTTGECTCWRDKRKTPVETAAPYCKRDDSRTDPNDPKRGDLYYYTGDHWAKEQP